VRPGVGAWCTGALGEDDGRGGRDMEMRRSDRASADGVPVIDHQFLTRDIQDAILIVCWMRRKCPDSGRFNHVSQCNAEDDFSNAIVCFQAQKIWFALAAVPDGQRLL
jgi:hypothetical protein